MRYLNETSRRSLKRLMKKYYKPGMNHDYLICEIANIGTLSFDCGDRYFLLSIADEVIRNNQPSIISGLINNRRA